jgi:hypothetical protein
MRRRLAARASGADEEDPLKRREDVEGVVPDEFGCRLRRRPARPQMIVAMLDERRAEPQPDALGIGPRRQLGREAHHGSQRRTPPRPLPPPVPTKNYVRQFW